MKVLVNGSVVELPAGARVADALAASGTEPQRGVAVAVAGEVVPRAEWGERRLAEGQAVEVVQAVQGG